MTDIVDKATRSRMMSGIRGKDTKPERVVRSTLHRAGLRFRLHAKGLPGRPDIILPRHRAVVLVHGCFWHRHNDCRFAYTPKSRPAFWSAKFASNVARDDRNISALRREGWRVFIVWECDVRAGRVANLPLKILANSPAHRSVNRSTKRPLRTRKRRPSARG